MNFLDDYAIFSSGDEAPPDFHFWAGLSALSACCGPNLWLDMGKYNLQPNLYIMLVGPPGIRKSTAKNVAQSIIAGIKNIPMVPSSITKEAFVKELSQEKSRHKMVYQWLGKPRSYTKAAIMSDEFVNLVSHGGDPLGYIQLLTEIYNPTPTFETTTISRGKTEMPYPYISLLGCITPELTSNLINQGALSGGFSRRTLYIYCNRNGKPVPRPVLTDDQVHAKDRLIQRGRMIQCLNGPFKFSDAGDRYYTNWYNENFYGLQEASTTAIANFLQSKADQVLKVAMLRRIAEHDDLILDVPELEFARRHVDQAQTHINTVFAAAGRNPHAATIAGILSFVNQRTTVSPHYVTEKRIIGNFIKDAPSQVITDILKSLVNSEPPQLHLKGLTVGVNHLQVYTSPANLPSFLRTTGASKGQTPPGNLLA
jgi:hypothetical protein